MPSLRFLQNILNKVVLLTFESEVFEFVAGELYEYDSKIYELESGVDVQGSRLHKNLASGSNISEPALRFH